MFDDRQVMMVSLGDAREFITEAIRENIKELYTPSEYMTFKEVMEFWKISKPTVTAAMQDGKLTAYRHGEAKNSIIRFKRTEVQVMFTVKENGDRARRKRPVIIKRARKANPRNSHK